MKRYSVTIPSEEAKTRVERNLPMLTPSIKSISLLIQARHPNWEKEIPVFCSNEGTILNTQTWGDRLEMYSKKLESKIRPYDLRHAFALLYLRSGGHAFGLQKTLGHIDMSMTRRYVNLSGQDLQEVHRLASPLNRLIISKSKDRIVNLKK